MGQMDRWDRWMDGTDGQNGWGRLYGGREGWIDRWLDGWNGWLDWMGQMGWDGWNGMDKWDGWMGQMGWMDEQICCNLIQMNGWEHYGVLTIHTKYNMASPWRRFGLLISSKIVYFETISLCTFKCQNLAITNQIQSLNQIHLKSLCKNPSQRIN